jgi:transposase
LTDPEVPEKAQRRKFSAEEKKRILEDVDRATGHGGIGAVLRREGIYSSTLHAWRKERDAAVHKAFSQKRGPQTRRNPLAGENEKLRRQNQRLQEELEKAHIVIDVQKKWPSYWVVRFQRSPARRSDHDRSGPTPSFGGREASLSSTVRSARYLVPASETPSLCLAGGRTAAFTPGAFRKRTVRRAGVSS